jgi:hypothetical protein
VLLILIPAIWLAVVLFALAIFRLAALSDDADTLALATRIAASYGGEGLQVPSSSRARLVLARPSSATASGLDFELDGLERAVSRTRIE